jgi:two-component system, NarL family, response regulator DevR
MIRVLLVDDHPLYRLGVSTLLGTVPDVEVVGEAESTTEAVELADRLVPDVVLMDVRLRSGSGVEACREIRARQPHARILMLTSFPHEEALVTSLLAGASGYLLKDSEPTQLVEAITTLSTGGSLLDPTTTQTLLDWMRREGAATGPDPLAGLSAHERKILPLIAEGKINRDIAAALSLSEHTVKTYVSNILRKLQLTRRSELAAFIARIQQSERTR